MKILLTTHQMADFAGSEIFTYELAKGLSNAGHKVIVYSRYIDKFEYMFHKANIKLVSDLKFIQNTQFEVAHVHHHINALEVRSIFPDLPIFYLSHGAKTFLENPPGFDVNIAHYGAVSKLVAKNLIAHGVKKNNISIVNNIVDETKFVSKTPINPTIKNALIISNRMKPSTYKKIDRACKELGIHLDAVGKSFRKVDNAEIPKLINKADVVFTIGRGVIESMMCGRIPFIFDNRGGDGLLNINEFNQSAKFHFNGFAKKIQFSSKQIKSELKKYNASDSIRLQTTAIARYSIKSAVTQLEKIYETTIKKHKKKIINQSLLFYVVETVKVTRQHTFSRSEQTGILAKIRNLSQDFKSYRVL